MLEIDAFFRPVAVTLALLTTFLLLRDARSDFRARLGALFGIGTAAYMFCSGTPGGWGASSLLVPLCIGNSFFSGGSRWRCWRTTFVSKPYMLVPY